MELKNLGLDLAVIGSGISIAGVLTNNIFLLHREAMIIWCGSNILLMTYFYGHWKGYWDGGVSSATLFVLYAVMLITGLYGLWLA